MDKAILHCEIYWDVKLPALPPEVELHLLGALLHRKYLYAILPFDNFKYSWHAAASFDAEGLIFFQLRSLQNFETINLNN